MTTPKRKLDPAVEARQAIEKRIVRSLAEELTSAGYAITVDIGDEEPLLTKSKDVKAILEACFAVDECHLYLTKSKRKGEWIYLVFGNDGWDVICDYIISLKRHMKNTLELTERLSEQ